MTTKVTAAETAETAATNASIYDEEPEAVTTATPVNEENPTVPAAAFTRDASAIDAADIARPTFKLTQGLTPEVADGLIGSGRIFMPGVGDLGKTLTVVPRGYYKGKSINPRNQKEEEFYCFEMGVFPAGALSDLVVANTYFRGTGQATAREIIGAVARAGGFGKVALTLTVNQKQNGQGKWNVYGLSVADVPAADLERAANAQF